MNEKRITFEERDTSVGNNVEVSIHEESWNRYWKAGDLYLQIENSWAGDTESDFGLSASMTLTAKDARKLASWILDNVRAES